MKELSNEKKVFVIGHPSHKGLPHNASISDIMVYSKSLERIEVNGVLYEPTNDNHPMFFSDIKKGLTKEAYSISDRDLIKEFELVKNKKSNLSKKQRERIELEFAFRYKRVED